MSMTENILKIIGDGKRSCSMCRGEMKRSYVLDLEKTFEKFAEKNPELIVKAFLALTKQRNAIHVVGERQRLANIIRSCWFSNDEVIALFEEFDYAVDDILKY